MKGNQRRTRANMSVDQFLKKLEQGEIKMEPVPGPYPYENLKHKKNLLVEEWQTLTEETEYLLAECCRHLTTVGGTRSSARVRRAVAHLRTLRNLRAASENTDTHNFESLINTTMMALEFAKSCLAKHNAQPRKFISYDLDSGEPLNEPDYSNIDPEEIIRSMGLSYQQPNRAERRKMRRKGVLH